MISAKSYISCLPKGAGQVMLQCSALTGLLFMAGLLCGCGSMASFAGGLIGLAVSTLVGYKVSEHDCRMGLWGFNGMLVGCAVFAFVQVSVWAWMLVVIGAMLTVPLRRIMDRMLAPAGTGAFTLPFVVVTWGIILIASAMGLEPVAEAGSATEQATPFSLWWWMAGCFNGVSQVFLMRSPLAGVILVIGLAMHSPKAALWAVAASAMSMALAMYAGVSPQDVEAGLYGFSPVLSAIAVSALPVRRTCLKVGVVVMAVVLTLLVQLAMEAVAGQVGLPVLTAPFCMVSCLFVAFGNKCRH